MSVVRHLIGRFGNRVAAAVLDPPRPLRGLVVQESLCGLVFGVATLPFTTPAAAAIPEWVQLLGLATLVGTVALKLRCWRSMLTAGLRRSATPLAHHMAVQVRDERRVRLGALVFAAIAGALLPIPATWVTFWFTLNLTTIALATVTLAAPVVRGHYRRAVPVASAERARPSVTYSTTSV